MADEIIGVGTTLAGSVLGEVLAMRDVEGPNDESDDIDISSNLDAVEAAEYKRRFRKGMGDPGEITVTCVTTAAGYAAAKTREAARGGETFTITAEDGSTIVTGATSYVKAVSPSFPWEGESVFEITIKCSGPSTYTA